MSENGGVPDGAVIFRTDVREMQPGDYLRMADQNGGLRWQRIEHVEVQFDTRAVVEFYRPGDDKLGAIVYDLPLRGGLMVEIARTGNETRPRRGGLLRRLWRG